MPARIAKFVQQMLVVLVCLCAGATHVAAQEVDATSYRLGPSDEIRLRVVAWNSNTLTFVDLEAISGTYVVEANGTVMLPIVGALTAEGLETGELAAQVTEVLQQRSGLAEPPSVAIGIERYRPIFVLGNVARPGEYPYRPGLRAVQALVLAGGYYREVDTLGSGLVREELRVAGSIREARIELVAARIREARLIAEGEGKTDFDLIADLRHPDGPAAIAQIYAVEKGLMQTRREALARSVESLTSSRALLETETTVLREKSDGLDQQVALMTKAVNNQETLVERGLSRSPDLLNMQRALFELESRQLDTQNQVFRAQQAMGEIERSLNDVTQRSATDILNETQNLQAQLARLETRLDTQERILMATRAEALVAEEDETVAIVPVFRVSRDIDGQFDTFIVDPDTLLRPLDVLEVSWADPPAAAAPFE